MQIPCVYIPGPAPAVSVANNTVHKLSFQMEKRETEAKAILFNPFTFW